VISDNTSFQPITWLLPWSFHTLWVVQYNIDNEMDRTKSFSCE